MKSISSGRAMARARSAMNMAAPLSTPIEQRGPAGVVGGDLRRRARRPAAWSAAASTTISPRSGLSIRCWRRVAIGHVTVRDRSGQDEPAAAAADRPAAADLAGHRLAARPRRGPGRRWRGRAGAARRRRAASAAPPGGPAAAGAAARAAASVGSSARGQLVEQVGVVAEQRRPGGPAPGRRRARRCRRAAGSSSWRTRLRRWTGSRLLGSCTGSRPELGAQRVGLGPPQATDRAGAAGRTRPARRGPRRAAG